VRLVLASASPRRRHLLAEHGYEFQTAVADITEVTPAHLTPGETVLYNARAKAQAVARLQPDALVLGVDTLVAFDERVFGKPADMDEAFAMLSRLNGRAHEVFSGVWLCHWDSGRQYGFIEATRVHFRHLAEPRLRAYMNRIGPLDKAGAYAAQDDNGELIEQFEGSFSNVIGLPMERFALALEHFTDGSTSTDQSIE
jgi:septum formation protein